MSIRLKLSLVFALLALGAFLPTIVITGQAVRIAAAHKVDTDIGHALQEITDEVEQQRILTADRINVQLGREEITRALSAGEDNDADFGLGDRHSEKDAVETAHLLLTSADLSGLKGGNHIAFLVVNRHGKVLFNDALPKSFGTQVRGLAVLDEALKGIPGTDLWSHEYLRKAVPFPLLKESKDKPGDLLLVIAQPLKYAGDLVGAVLIGESIQDEVLPDLKNRDDGRIIALRTPDGELGTIASEMDAVKAYLASPTQKQNAFQMARATYAGAQVPLVVHGKTLGTALLVRALDPEIRSSLETFWTWMGPSFLVILLAAISFGFLISRRLAEPLVLLESAAREVERGNLAVRVEPKSNDEIGRLASTFNQMVQGLRQRDEIKGLFKRYLNPQVVEELIRHPERASPGGERRELTLLFCDLVGFTSTSEKMSPEALVALLNRYFEEATRAVAQHGATLDKFIGDAIMCFWNAPLPQEEHARLACLAALDLTAVVKRLAPQFEAQGFGVFSARIGVNTGSCVVGNLGSSQAQDYTAVGDAVNIASRLEGACKVYGTGNLVSESTYLPAAGAVEARELDLIRVKGRAHATRIYELIGPKGTPIPEHARCYADGLAHFRTRRFQEALGCFARSPQDPPSVLFAARCQAFIAEPPPAEWDAVHTLSEK